MRHAAAEKVVEQVRAEIEVEDTRQRRPALVRWRFGALGFYSSIKRLLFQTLFSADTNIGIGRPRVLYVYGLFPDVRTFDVSRACL